MRWTHSFKEFKIILTFFILFDHKSRLKFIGAIVVIILKQYVDFLEKIVIWMQTSYPNNYMIS